MGGIGTSIPLTHCCTAPPSPLKSPVRKRPRSWGDCGLLSFVFLYLFFLVLFIYFSYLFLFPDLGQAFCCLLQHNDRASQKYEHVSQIEYHFLDRLPFDGKIIHYIAPDHSVVEIAESSAYDNGNPRFLGCLSFVLAPAMAEMTMSGIPLTSSGRSFINPKGKPAL